MSKWKLKWRIILPISVILVIGIAAMVGSCHFTAFRQFNYGID